jgi:hypothetical protein
LEINMPDATATYIGGPLDGQIAARQGTRWSAYRRDDGAVATTESGDAEWHRPKKGKTRRRFYAFQRGAAGRIFYVHATTWEEFQATRWRR